MQALDLHKSDGQYDTCRHCAEGAPPVTDAAPGTDAAATGGAANGTANGASAAPAKKKKAKKGLKQTEPPTVTVKRLYPDGVYPEGEWQPYKQE